MKDSDPTLRELGEMVGNHSAKYWHISRDLDDYERHVLEHLAKLIGKL